MRRVGSHARDTVAAVVYYACPSCVVASGMHPLGMMVTLATYKGELTGFTLTPRVVASRRRGMSSNHMLQSRRTCM